MSQVSERCEGSYSRDGLKSGSCDGTRGFFLEDCEGARASAQALGKAWRRARWPRRTARSPSPPGRRPDECASTSSPTSSDCEQDCAVRCALLDADLGVQRCAVLYSRKRFVFAQRVASHEEDEHALFKEPACPAAEPAHSCLRVLECCSDEDLAEDRADDCAGSEDSRSGSLRECDAEDAEESNHERGDEDEDVQLQQADSTVCGMCPARCEPAACCGGAACAACAALFTDDARRRCAFCGRSMHSVLSFFLYICNTLRVYTHTIY